MWQMCHLTNNKRSIVKLTFFDIETYKQLFCLCTITFDSETHNELSRHCVTSTADGRVFATEVNAIKDALAEGDYIISYNGQKFDLPVLAKIVHDVKRMGMSTSKYINADADAIIGYDRNNHPMVKNFHTVKEWTVKHFDLLNDCLLGKSLKQWEMYCNLPIKELPYSPDSELTEDMKREIVEYCFHDVWATAQVYWRFGSGEQKTKYHTLRARKAIFDKLWNPAMPFRFDRSPQAVAAGIIYQTTTPIPPKTFDPLELFDVDDFDVPQEVKDIIRFLARNSLPKTASAKEKREFAERTNYKGIQFGKGGCHFIRKGLHKNLYCLDVQSEYPRVIDHWHLLKTPEAQANWKDAMEKRFALKALKGTPQYEPDLDLGMKILVLNALSGGFRIQSGASVAFDPAAGEAMCYIGQLVVTELAFACPDWESVIEINTDSVFVVGEENIKVLRKKADQMLQKYNMLFEEEFMEQAYFRDVNNYGIYDKDGNLLDGRGLDYSDAINKNHEKAVVYELFRNLVRDGLSIDWGRYDWKDFIYKYHKSSASKYATIGDKPMDHKNYYFLWTTRACPDAQPISFSNSLMDSRNGSIKPRFGVYAFDIADLEKYKGFIDYTQYQRDLDENFYLWGREDHIRTFLGNAKERRAKGIKVKSLADAFALAYPWSEPVNG